MNKLRADPLNPPIEDIQGYVYQHELGDPDNAQQLEHMLRRQSRAGMNRPHRREEPRVPATVTDIDEYRRRRGAARPDDRGDLPSNFPLENYPKLSVEQILTRALALGPEEIDQVIAYERRHRNRRIVIDGLERSGA